MVTSSGDAELVGDVGKLVGDVVEPVGDVLVRNILVDDSDWSR